MSGTGIPPGSAADAPEDFGTDRGGRAQRWHAEIQKAQKESEVWWRKCRRIIDRYRDEGHQSVPQDVSVGMKMNLLWSNCQTLAPSLYASPPQPVVKRRFDDQDDLGRIASEILERCIAYEIEEADLDTTMRQVVLDNLLAGRGTVWLRYEPRYGQAPQTKDEALLSLPVPQQPVTPQPMPAAMGGMPTNPPPAGGGMPGTPAMPPAGGLPTSGPPAPPQAPPMPMQTPAPPQMQSQPPAPVGPLAGLAQGAIPLGPSPPAGSGASNRRSDGGLQVADDGEQDNASYIAYESVHVDHVHWEDWLCSPARTWAEVRWVARRVYMTKDELAKRFGRAIADDVPLRWLPKDVNEAEALMPHNMLFRRAEVYEIWDKPSRRVCWLAEGYNDRLLDECDDPLRLLSFFPTPRPLFATLTSDSLIPVPDYYEYRDQANEIDSLTARIAQVTKAIKVCGVYDGAQQSIERIFNEGVENQLIPVNQWGMFAERGGLKGAIDILDVSSLSETLEKLVSIRAQAKQDLYEITGISDIIRGSTVASETATAQQIKAGWGTMRLRARQTEVSRFCRDVMRLVGEIVAEHFQPRTIAMISDIAMHVDQTEIADYQQRTKGRHLIQDALQLLQDEKIRPLRIDIETDSTIMANQQYEQQARTQFLTMASGFLQQAVPALTQHPQLAPLLGQMLLFGVRAFPQGTELEGAFEQAVRQMQIAVQSGQAQPPPDPKMMLAQAQVQNIQSQIADRQTDDLRQQQEAGSKERAQAAQAMLDAQKARDDATLRSAELHHTREDDARNFVLESYKAVSDANRPRGQASGARR